MSGFSEASLQKKLAELNNSAPSIQQLSLWVVHHKKHIQTIVRVWYRELGAVPVSRKLTFLYLANDVVQNARKYPEVGKEFGTVMKRVFDHFSALDFDEKTVNSIGRVVHIWEERTIFDKRVQEEIKRIWAERKSKRDRSPHTPPLEPSPAKKRHADKEATVAPYQPASAKDTAIAGGHLPTYLDLDFSGDGGEDGDSNAEDPPEPSELIEVLQELENSASSDAVVREKIAQLPPEVSDINHLSTLTTEEEAQKLLHKVQAASTLLEDYNRRLELELVERRRVGRMVASFLQSQKELMIQAEERLDTYRDRLDKVRTIEEELRQHLSSLPDIPSPVKAENIRLFEK